MSKGGQQQQQIEFGSTGRGGSGFINKRTTVINRSTPHYGGGAGATFGSSRMSYGGSFGGLSLAPGTYASMSHDGVANMKGKRESEKKEMQGLNERLGSYIEKVKFLEGQIIQYEQELEYYRNQKHHDWKEIRDLYENELAQARRVIDDLSSEKAGIDAKIAGLQDLADSLRATIETLESQNKDLRSKIDSQADTIGRYEGELGTLRLRVGNLEDDNTKLRQLNNQKNEEIRSLRADLDNATAAQIDADCRATSLEEELEFLKAVMDKLPTQAPEPVKIKGLDLENFWKDNMARAIRDIQNEYDNKLDIMRQEIEMRNQANMRQLQSGAVRDNMETVHAKEESKKLKSQLQGTGSKLAELEAKIASLEADRSDLKGRLKIAEDELEREQDLRISQTEKMRIEMEDLMRELNAIMDAKLSLELEIACYKKLLEGEEDRLGLKQVIEQAVGSKNKGASQLSEIVQQSTLSESTGKLTVQRSARGPIGFVEASHEGKYVIVENTSKGDKAKDQDLTGWKIIRHMSGQEPITYNFLKGEVLRPGRQLKIWASGAAKNQNIRNEANSNADRCCDEFSWGSGSGKTTLVDKDKSERAGLRAEFRQ